VKLLLLSFTVLLGVPVMLWSGFALTILWGWFFVPLSVPPIGIAHSIGLAVIVC
jgi:hypothetical protein